MTIEQARVNNTLHIRITGQMDASLSLTFRRVVDPYLANTLEPVIVIDLTRVTRITSSGLGLLSYLQEASARKRRRELTLVIPSTPSLTNDTLASHPFSEVLAGLPDLINILLGMGYYVQRAPTAKDPGGAP
ncbi:MAG: STAS domain-containing protein, partial [Magnetococcales bacterium]|nr:STAS domain-containing protein [Magnetococcales bacterium]